jgi:hypothetical protein
MFTRPEDAVSDRYASTALFPGARRHIARPEPPYPCNEPCHAHDQHISQLVSCRRRRTCRGVGIFLQNRVSIRTRAILRSCCSCGWSKSICTPTQSEASDTFNLNVAGFSKHTKSTPLRNNINVPWIQMTLELITSCLHLTRQGGKTNLLTAAHSYEVQNGKIKSKSTAYQMCPLPAVSKCRGQDWCFVASTSNGQH